MFTANLFISLQNNEREMCDLFGIRTSRTAKSCLAVVLLSCDLSTVPSSSSIVAIKVLWSVHGLFVYNFVSDYPSHLQHRYHRSNYAVYVDSRCVYCPSVLPKVEHCYTALLRSYGRLHRFSSSNEH